MLRLVNTTQDYAWGSPTAIPDLILALTPFDVLCGFRRALEAAELLSGLEAPLARDLAMILRSQSGPEAIPAAVRRLLDEDLCPSAAEVEEVAGACRARLVGGSPEPGADRTVVSLADAYPGDPGVVTSLLLNQLTLQPGEAMFVPAGAVHAYQHGVGVEIMASSDNVLRAGRIADRGQELGDVQVLGGQAGPPARVIPEPVSSATQVFRA